ncbi:hypothetical protein V1294_006044 [Bradyrhizobium sp. AZCC 1678]
MGTGRRCSSGRRMTRPGGFPRIKRPDPKTAPVTPVAATPPAEVVTASPETAPARVPMPATSRWPRPKAPPPPKPWAGPKLPPMPSVPRAQSPRPVTAAVTAPGATAGSAARDRFLHPNFGDVLVRAGLVTSSRPAAAPAPQPTAQVEVVAPAASVERPPVPEPEYDEDGRRLITTPLQSPARPVPTVLHPGPTANSGLPRVQRPPPSAPKAPPAPVEKPRLSMYDAGKLALRRPVNKTQQPASASTQKLPKLTADDIPF